MFGHYPNLLEFRTKQCNLLWPAPRSDVVHHHGAATLAAWLWRSLTVIHPLPLYRLRNVDQRIAFTFNFFKPINFKSAAQPFAHRCWSANYLSCIVIPWSASRVSYSRRDILGLLNLKPQTNYHRVLCLNNYTSVNLTWYFHVSSFSPWAGICSWRSLVSNASLAIVPKYVGFSSRAGNIKFSLYVLKARNHWRLS